MFEDKLIKNLKENEEPVAVIRKFWLVFLGRILLSMIFIIAPFFFLYPLLKWSNWGLLVFAAISVFGIMIALRTFIVYSFNVFIITNQRIIDIDQRGFFDRTVSETTYNKIQDVSFRIKGVMQTLYHYGSIIVQTAGAQANIELSGIKDPERIQQTIIELQKENRDDKNITAEEIINILRRVNDGGAKETTEKK
ncbi:MAG: PH domain-containing protein [Patescibacteria group bacterium]|jgi:membrane protein YdbS with pleckstrin-like domain